MKLSSSLFLLLSLFFAISCQHKQRQIPRDIASLRANDQLEGVWFVQGSSSIRGPYNGEIEFRKSTDGTYNVVRIVTYINSFFDGLKIQEVWTGKAVANPDSILVNYEINQAEFITKLGKHKREKSDFENKVSILSEFRGTGRGLSTDFSDKKLATYSEWLTTRSNLGSSPLWQNERSLPLPSVVIDPTDFSFYRKNNDVIRLVNKISDNIALTEAAVKRNAYALTLEQKAKSYENRTQRIHTNEFGFIRAVYLNDQGQVVRASSADNEAYITSLYLASQAMRYESTNDHQALENLKRATTAVINAFDINSNKTNFAMRVRKIAPSESNQTSQTATQLATQTMWLKGEGKFESFEYIENKGTEAIIAVIHGLTWAAKALPESEAALRNELKRIAEVLPKLEGIQESPPAYSSALGLAAYLSSDKQDLLRYVENHKSIEKLKATQKKIRTTSKTTSKLTSKLSSGEVVDADQPHLVLLNFISEIYLSQFLDQMDIRDKMRSHLMDSWVGFNATYAPLFTIGAYGYAFRNGVRGTLFAKKYSDKEFEEKLKQSMWGLREIPYPRPFVEVKIDRNAKKTNGSAYRYPAFEGLAFDSAYIWARNKSESQFSNPKGLEHSGVDYLYAYWLAHYVGALNDI